jgi:hypothetical protein
MDRPFTSVTALRASADMSDCLKAHLDHPPVSAPGSRIACRHRRPRLPDPQQGPADPIPIPDRPRDLPKLREPVDIYKYGRRPANG